MWHEARKQERKIRGLMVDYKKRAERRREYYEKIKQDPTQFLRVYGRPYKIHLDPAIAMSAESPQSMMPWQGQTDNMIDRFDVRAHLDFIPEYKFIPSEPLSKEEAEEERKCSYERYRTLVENECAALNEEQCLYQIYLDEQFGPINKTSEEEKKKLAEKKAAIGFVYEDSTLIVKDENEDSSDTDVETADLDVTLDVDTLTPDQLSMLNQCAEQYGMHGDDYVRFLRKDKEELEALRQAKLLEEEKAQFAGRKSRRERRAYKEKKLQGRKISPPSYAARSSPKYEPYKRSSSSSKSRSPSPENAGKVTYITSFGGESDNDGGILQGPSLPPLSSNLQAQSEKSDTKMKSWKPHGAVKVVKNSPRGKRQRSRSKSRTYKHRHRRSRSRSISRSRSRSRSHSRNRSHRHARWHHSRSRSRSRTGLKDQKRAYSYYNRNFKNRSYHQTSRRCYSKSPSSSERSSSLSRSRSRSASKSSSSSSSTSNSKSRSKSKSPRRSSKSRSHSKSKSPIQSSSAPKPVIKKYRRESLSSSSSGLSDSDSGSENKHFLDVQTKTRGIPGSNVLGKAILESQNRGPVTPQEKLRRRMQTALNKQYKADKRAEYQKLERIEQERQDREDELRARVMEMRRREREKRHRELEELERERYSRKYSSSSDNSSWSRSPSPYLRSRSRSLSRSPSKSRSRSRSGDRGRLVDY